MNLTHLASGSMTFGRVSADMDIRVTMSGRECIHQMCVSVGDDVCEAVCVNVECACLPCVCL